MKTKKLAITLIVICSSVASVYSTVDMVAPAYVHVLFLGQTNWVCVNSGRLCDEFPAYLCTLYVPDLGRTTPAYYPGCAVPLFHSQPIAGIYDPAAIIIDAD